MELGFYSMSIALALGLTLGILASLKPNSFLDYLPSSMAMVGICLPTFVLGPLLVLVFALKLQWFPYPGWDTPATKVLPSLTLGAYYAAYIARLTRGGMREILTQDLFVRTRQGGLCPGDCLASRAARGSATCGQFHGPCFCRSGGSFVIETIFNVLAGKTSPVPSIGITRWCWGWCSSCELDCRLQHAGGHSSGVAQSQTQLS